MGFFKSLNKAMKQASKPAPAAKASRSAASAPPPKFNPKKVPTVDPADLTLPDELPTDVAGVTVKKAAPAREQRIGIVGEQWKQENIAGVKNACGGREFDIYLMLDPQNQYDKKAVGVWAGGVQVGFIPKPDNNVWHKLVTEANTARELLWGRGRIYNGSADFAQVSGFIYAPNTIAPDVDAIEPKRMTPAAMEKAKTTLEGLVGAYPDTLAQARSHAKKVAKALAPVYAHSLAVLADTPDNSDWADIQDMCLQGFDEAADVAFLGNVDDYDDLSSADEVLDLLKKLPA